MLFLTPQCVIQDFQASVLQVSDSTYDEQYVTFFFLVKLVASFVCGAQPVYCCWLFLLWKKVLSKA